jgi:hypothetical protein
LELATVADCSSAMKHNKERSSKVLMVLISVMYINQTILVVLRWYLAWLAYVKYSDSNDRALAVILLSENTPLVVFYIAAVETLLVTIRLGVADSMMVFHLILYLLCYSLGYTGLALLDHL